MDGRERDLDSLAEEAWRGFREALADAIDALADPGDLVVELDGGDEVDETWPYIGVRRAGDEICLEVASNPMLSPRHRLAKPARRYLRDLGLAKPGARPEYWSTFPVSRVDEVASVAVAALRGAFGVVHPAFLTGLGFDWPLGQRGSAAQEPDVGTVLAVYPADHEHLDLLIDRALARMFGQVPSRDSDGDIPIPVGSAVVYVRGREDARVIHLFAEVVARIRDREVAERVVADFNREFAGVKFTLHDDRVFAGLDVAAWPFVDEHLIASTIHLCEVVAQHAEDLARRVRGRVSITATDPSDGLLGEESEDGSDDYIHPVMLRLLQLDAAKPGSIRPKDAAKLCGHDCDLLLELIQWNEEQELSWEDARDEAYAGGDPDEAAACEHERAHAERTIKILRKALRRVLLG